MTNLNFRAGIGYDIHKLVSGRNLIIGGVQIPYEKGLLGHSDADVLVHAIIDGILGALALPDIGTLFPDTDSKYKDADSILLLQEVMNMVNKKGFKINNIDSNIIAQEPKMMPYIQEMKNKLAPILGLPIENISVKAKTKEHLDSVGAKEAIEAQAVVLMVLDK